MRLHTQTLFMKKILSILLLAVVCLVLQGNTTAEQPGNQPATKRTQEKITNNHALLSYYWYNDAAYTDFTGSITTIANELDRLRSTYPGAAFKTYPDIGYYAFEFGYYSPSITAVIYSNW